MHVNKMYAFPSCIPRRNRIGHLWVEIVNQLDESAFIAVAFAGLIGNCKRRYIRCKHGSIGRNRRQGVKQSRISGQHTRNRIGHMPDIVGPYQQKKNVRSSRIGVHPSTIVFSQPPFTAIARRIPVRIAGNGQRIYSADYPSRMAFMIRVILGRTVGFRANEVYRESVGNQTFIEIVAIGTGGNGIAQRNNSQRNENRYGIGFG